MIKKSFKEIDSGKTTQDLLNLIQIDPHICHGKPVFKGTRIMVYIILELLAGGLPPEEIISNDYYPQLTKRHIQAALQYASVVMNPGDYISFSRT